MVIVIFFVVLESSGWLSYREGLDQLVGTLGVKLPVVLGKLDSDSLDDHMEIQI